MRLWFWRIETERKTKRHRSNSCSIWVVDSLAFVTHKRRGEKKRVPNVSKIVSFGFGWKRYGSTTAFERYCAEIVSTDASIFRSFRRSRLKRRRTSLRRATNLGILCCADTKITSRRFMNVLENQRHDWRFVNSKLLTENLSLSPVTPSNEPMIESNEWNVNVF